MLTGALLMAVLVAVPTGADGAVLTCAGARVTLRGTSGPNRLVGTAGRDVIAGLGGNDTIFGQGGNDTICGGAGNDTIRGGPGGDRVDGGAGDDTITGDAGVDRLFGQAGNDRLNDTSPGADILTGGADNGIDICTPTAGDVVDCDYSTTDPLIVAPFQAPPSPASLRVASDSDLGAVDLYTIVDRSGSMEAEANAIRDNLGAVVDDLQCAPWGTGLPGDCIEDLWAGVGSVGYADSGADAFRNLLDIQENPNVATLSSLSPPQ